MVRGYGMQFNDWILAGAVAFVAYSVYKVAVSPASRITGVIADKTEEAVETISTGKTWVGRILDSPFSFPFNVIRRF